MSIADVLVVGVIVVLAVLAVRSFLRSEDDGCNECGSASACSVHAQGGTCKVADDMIARANAAVEARDAGGQGN